MKIFLKSTDILQLEELNSWGVIDGISIDSGLIKKSGKPSSNLLKEIENRIGGTISIEITGLESSAIVSEAIELNEKYKNVIIKIPITQEGLKSIKILSKKGIKTCATLIFSPVQAILAAKAGAFLIAPYMGRMEESGYPSVDIIDRVIEMVKNHYFDTKIFIEYIRTPAQFLNISEKNVYGITATYDVIKKGIYHPLTDQGIERILNRWESN